MDEYMLSEAVPMYGRMVHSVSGDTKLLKYSGRDGEYINSVSRAGLNIALINEAEKYEQVSFHFNERCVDFDCKTGVARFAGGTLSSGKTVIATDGAGSAVRNTMLHGGVERFDFSQVWLEHGYKELHIPSLSELGREIADGSDANFRLEKNALHIWPRHKFMMIALPNFGGSFTCTLFLAHRGENSFEQIKSVPEFFNTNFPDALPLMPTLAEDFAANPIGNLGTIKCYPWNAGGKALLLGDSAHAVVPFYGQGMNCAFEDVRVLDQLIEKHGADWQTVYDEYGKLRKVNTDAIADMAEENFYEMRDAVADPVFVRKRDLETRLEHTYTDYFSKYSMVTFREDLPYSVAKEKGNAQDRYLMQICAREPDLNSIDLDILHEQLEHITENPQRV
jgi:kynurenine 3-monooxygenase